MKLKTQHQKTARVIWQESFLNDMPDFQVMMLKLQSLKGKKLREEEFILKALLERIMRYLREHRLKISAPNELTEYQREQILSLVGNIEKYIGGIEFCKNESLIGGLRIEKGYDVEDYSISRQLEILKSTLF